MASSSPAEPELATYYGGDMRMQVAPPPTRTTGAVLMAASQYCTARATETAQLTTKPIALCTPKRCNILNKSAPSVAPLTPHMSHHLTSKIPLLLSHFSHLLTPFSHLASHLSHLTPLTLSRHLTSRVLRAGRARAGAHCDRARGRGVRRQGHARPRHPPEHARRR
eukprot:1204384-Rhodomonas_salina.1